MEKTLLERAIEIRDEVTESQNTAERVGGVLVEVVEGRELAQDTVDQLVEKQAAVEKRVTANESFLDILSEQADALELDLEFTSAKLNNAVSANTRQDQELVALRAEDKSIHVELLNQHQLLGEYRDALDIHSAKLAQYPEQMMLDLGLVESQDAGYAMAARSEIAGNRSISFIRFRVQGVSAEKVYLIIQWPNGIHETAQLSFVDKAQWRRNVTGATGNADDTTTATMFERTAPHYLGYDAANRKIQLKDYTQTVTRDVQLPLASTTTDGMLSRTSFANLNNFSILERSDQGTGQVIVDYRNPILGTQNAFYLLPATAARAGVMVAADKAALDRLVAAAAKPDYVELTFESYDSRRRRKVLPNKDYFEYIEVDGQVMKSDTVTAESGELRLYMTGGRHVVRCRPANWEQLYLFSGCDGLVEATLPAGVTGLPGKCFEQCTQLRRISLPDGLLTIGPWAFLNCSALEEITIPDTVTSIGTKCFELCSSLRKCTLGLQLHTLSEYAFLNCTALAELTIHSEALTLGGSGGTFPYCNKLAVIRCSAATAPTCESSNPFTDTTRVGRDVDAAQRKLYRPAGATGYTESNSKWKTGLIDQCGFNVVDAI